MEHADILHRCFRCGYCKLPANFVDYNCPAYLSHRFETFAPGGRMWLLRAWLDGKIDASDRFLNIMYSCATCGNCVNHCAMPKFRDEILLAFTAAKQDLVEQGRVPPGVRDFLTRVQKADNAYGLSRKKRLDWAAGLDAPEYAGQEYLLFVGDVAAFDPAGQRLARAAASLLFAWGVSFGVLGPAECADGNDVAACGERDLFAHVAQKNIAAFHERGVKKIICLSPHAFNALKNDYPALGGPAQVFHYTQPLALLSGAAKWRPDAPPVKVTYHDPCYLGRHNGEYEAARLALRAAPGVSLMEMPRNRKNALCCGGGGGNLFTDLVSGPGISSARARVREAAETGAEVIAVSCPACLVMLESAALAEGLDGKLTVADVAEVLSERIA